MTIVANHSSLSPAMRAALTSVSPADARKPTVDALVARGYLAMTGEHIRHLALTPAGKKARAALINGETPPPLKVAQFLDYAQKLGLSVAADDDLGGPQLRRWTITNPAPMDPTELWLYFTPGSNGGRLTIVHYRGTRPHGSAIRQRSVRVTRQMARIILTTMGESLERHRQRQARAARAEGADVVLAQDLGLTVEQLRERTDITKPGWFQQGQVIRSKDGAWHQVALIEYVSRADRFGAGVVGVVAVAVSTHGGHGRKLHWYGDHPDSVGDLSILDVDAGRPGHDRRPWPRDLRAARQGVANTIIDQVLTGWAASRAAGMYRDVRLPDHVVVNLPCGADPTRHLVLLRRYVPYQADVVLSPCHRDRGAGIGYPMIWIVPKGGVSL